MIKVILFDLGNVLAKPIDNHRLYKSLKTSLSYEEFEEYWFCANPVIDAHMGLVTDDYHVEELLKYCNSPLTKEEFYNIYMNIESSLYSDIIDIIKKLKSKKYKVGLLSNLRLMDYKRYEKQIKNIEFDYLFLSYKMKCIKPNVDIYKKVIDKCECNPKDIIFFDDNKKNVIGAKECGINAYQVTGVEIDKINNVLVSHQI